MSTTGATGKNDNPTNRPHDKFRIETEFRDFTYRLFMAEEEVHRENVRPYSPEALQKILKTYCDIIADDLNVQSCTIQLKSHDFATCPVLKLQDDPVGSASQDAPPIEDENVRAWWQRTQTETGVKWKGAHLKGAGPDVERRKAILRSALGFPHAVFGKGAMLLVAANEGSPWQGFAGWHLTELLRGVTTEIVQERAAKAHDPLSLRKERRLRKLGAMDPYIWTSQRSAGCSPAFFYTYYGVPIRIHSGGDVIGIIKVENKGLQRRETSLNASALNVYQTIDDIIEMVLDERLRRNCHTLAAALDDKMSGAERKIRDRGYKPRARSLFSLAYLAIDLARYGGHATTVGDVLTRKYQLRTHARESGLGAPPVQVAFDTIKEENDFAEWLARSNQSTKMLRRVVTFCRDLGQVHEERGAFNARLMRIIQRVIAEKGTTVEIGRPEEGMPDFGRRVTVSGRGMSHKFRLQVCPPRADVANITRMRREFGLTKDRARLYAKHYASSKGVSLAGEYFAGTDIIHFATDRIAARVCAFTTAFPIPEFERPGDATKLSWAAVEIGKLVERHISYSGAHSQPVVPLTSVDFHRLPISDLSFVTGLRQLRQDGETIQKSLAYHIPNCCRDLGFEQTVHHERTKEWRSYLNRLGRSHSAHYDALIALWSCLLHQKLGAAAPSDLQSALKKLRDCTACLCSPTELADLQQWSDTAGRLFDCPGIWPDLKFSAPPFTTDGKLDPILSQLRAAGRTSPHGLPITAYAQDLTGETVRSLLFRRYDYFTEMWLSLYLQIRNEKRCRERTGEKHIYVRFVELSRSLLASIRKKLEESEADVGIEDEGAPDLDVDVARRGDPISSFVASLRTVKSAVFGKSTEQFAHEITSRRQSAGRAPKRETDYLRLGLSIPGIYKRIRTLLNTSSNQVPPYVLHWQNARFDYVGARVTCLFKGQVFAVYEDLWNRGDPFRALAHSQPDRMDGSRQRWFCLRTKVHRGEDGYSAWQIAALMDPAAVSDTHWNTSNVYSLRRLSRVLEKAYAQWDWDGKARYVAQADAKDKLKERYGRGLRDSLSVLDGSRHVSESPVPTFGKYLAQAPLDSLVDRLLDTKMHFGLDAIREVVDALARFVAPARAYSEGVVRPNLHGDETSGYRPPEALISAARRLYKTVARLAKKYPSTSSERDDRSLGNAELKQLSEQTDAPVVFVDEDCAKRVVQLRDALHQPMKGPDTSESTASVWRDQLESVIRQIQRGQLDYLYDVDSTGEPSLRGETDVLERLMCYILLGGCPKDQIDAYNWFYYLVSLVPVEFQVRTALADTMAEQYHRVYKLGAEGAKHASVQQNRLKEVARRLEQIDREMEVQFEDYTAAVRKQREQRARKQGEERK